MNPSDQIPPFPSVGHTPSRRLKRQEIVDHLAALPLFAGCSKRELRHLAGLTRHHQLGVGEHVFEQGAPSSAAYVIVAGHVEVRRHRQPIAELGPGDVVGELSLLLRRDHSATVSALTPIEVVALPRDALQEAVEDVPGLGWNLLQAVAARLSTDDIGSD